MSTDVSKGWLGRLFTLRNAVKVLLWTATLIVLFYAEENWRGARMWAATKAKWEAKGETFDFNHFIPAPIPDAQNLGALPIFQLEFSPEEPKDREPVRLRKALRGPSGNSRVSSAFGNWMKGDRPDIARLTNEIAIEYRQQFKEVVAPSDALAQLDALFPWLAELRDASATKPFCRFPYDDSYEMPASRPLGLITSQIALTKLLTLHALLALHQHQSDLALADLKTIYQLLPGAEADPTLVGSLVAMAMSAVAENAIVEGLALHAWDDQQLSEIQGLLQRPHFLADYAFGLRTGAAESAANLDWLNAHREKLAESLLGLGDDLASKDTPWFYRWILNHYSLWPSGSMDQNKARYVDYHFNALRVVDSKAGRVFPGLAGELERQIQQAIAGPEAGTPWNFIFLKAVPSLVSQPMNFARGQVWIDQGRIACALERYHLVHGVYPETLDALQPAFISGLPHDVITGEPYRYGLRPDGTFLLYSVGWNQKDDGGKVDFEKDTPGKIDNKQGDWVWPTMKAAESSP